MFGAIDSHAWSRLMRWIRAKYKGKNRLGMKELRRRFCDKGWRFACNGVVFTGASSVAVPLPLPRQQDTNPVDPGPGNRRVRLNRRYGTWRARCVERRTAGSAGGSGKRTGRKASTAPRPDPPVHGMAWSAVPCSLLTRQNRVVATVVRHSETSLAREFSIGRDSLTLATLATTL